MNMPAFSTKRSNLVKVENMTNYSDMTIEELVAEKAKIDEAIEAKKADKIAELRKQALELGISASDLFGAAAKGGSKAKAAPKYAHPENPALTWSGRGKHPQWMAEHLANGGEKEDLLIEKQ